MNIQQLLVQEAVPHADRTHRHGRTGWVQVDCPQCGPGSGHFHCGLRLGVPAANCWRCGKLNFWEVMRSLGLGPAQTKALDFAPQTPDLQPVHTGRYTVPKGLGPLQHAHTAYLLGRGLDPVQAVAMWGAKGLGMHSRLPWRIWFPIHDAAGRPISWTTRAIGKREKKKYLTASAEEEASPHKEGLYGVEKCRGHSVIVVEGPLDVWNVGPGAAGTYGLGHTAAQVAAIAGYTNRVICFDNSPEAQHRADQLCKDLAVWPGSTHKVNLDAADPGCAEAGEVAELRRFAGI